MLAFTWNIQNFKHPRNLGHLPSSAWSGIWWPVRWYSLTNRRSQSSAAGICTHPPGTRAPPQPPSYCLVLTWKWLRGLTSSLQKWGEWGDVWVWTRAGEQRSLYVTCYGYALGSATFWRRANDMFPGTCDSAESLQMDEEKTHGKLILRTVAVSQKTKKTWWVKRKRMVMGTWYSAKSKISEDNDDKNVRFQKPSG